MTMARASAALLLALAGLASAPAAQAQADFEIALDAADLGAPVPYRGTASIPVNVTASCLAGLRSMGGMATATAVATVTVADPPAWLTVVEPAQVDVTPGPDCATGGGEVRGSGAVVVAVGPDAPGVVDHTLNLTATLPAQGDPMTAQDAAVLNVTYHSNYTLAADVAFPLTVTAARTSFNLTVTQASNARSMVMMEEIRTSAGVLSGLASTVYENEAGRPASKTFTVTFTAPAGAWNASTTRFTAYGHYLLLDSRSGPFDAGTPVTWEFRNGMEPADDHDHGEDQESPAPAAVLTALGLLGLAGARRRRHG